MTVSGILIFSAWKSLLFFPKFALSPDTDSHTHRSWSSQPIHSPLVLTRNSWSHWSSC